MRNRWQYLLVLGLLICVSPAFAQPEDSALRKEIQGFFRQWDRLVNSGQWGKALRMVDPSWVMVGPEEEIFNYKTLLGMSKEVKRGDVRSHIVVNSVQANGNEVVAWVTQTMMLRSRVKGRYVWDKHTERFAETFRRTPEGLKFVYTQALPNSRYWGWARR